MVAKSHATKYAWPKGWLTRDQAADDLECSPERVDEILRLPIHDGSVSRELFPVWNAKSERVVKLPGYRINPSPEVASAAPASAKIISPVTLEQEEAIRRIGENRTCAKQIQKNLPRRFRHTRLAQVRAVLGLA